MNCILPFFIHFHPFEVAVCKWRANALKTKKDNQEWKPPNCLILKPFGFVAGPATKPNKQKKIKDSI